MTTKKLFTLAFSMALLPVIGLAANKQPTSELDQTACNARTAVQIGAACIDTSRAKAMARDEGHSYILHRACEGAARPCAEILVRDTENKRFLYSLTDQACPNTQAGAIRTRPDACYGGLVVGYKKHHDALFVGTPDEYTLIVKQDFQEIERGKWASRGSVDVSVERAPRGASASAGFETTFIASVRDGSGEIVALDSVRQTELASGGGAASTGSIEDRCLDFASSRLESIADNLSQTETFRSCSLDPDQSNYPQGLVTLLNAAFGESNRCEPVLDSLVDTAFGMSRTMAQHCMQFPQHYFGSDVEAEADEAPDPELPDWIDDFQTAQDDGPGCKNFSFSTVISTPASDGSNLGCDHQVNYECGTLPGGTCGCAEVSRVEVACYDGQAD